MTFDYFQLAVILFLAAGFIFAVVPIIGSHLLAPHAKGGDLHLPYECGINPFGPGKIRFGMNYYFYALIFLAFEVDVLYLFPVSAFYPRSAGWESFFAVFLFLAVLFAAVIYFLRKGVFTWPRRIQP